MFRNFISGAINSIDKIEPKLHQIQLSGNYDYRKIEEKIGRLKVDDKYQPEERKKNYRNRAFRQMNDGTLFLVYYNPVYPYSPWSLIEFSYPTREILERLNEAFTDLTVSFAEYAVDLFCKRYSYKNQNNSIEQLYFLLKKYLYCPYQRSTGQKGEKVFQIGSKRIINAVYNVDKVKVYERGPDSKKKGSHWRYVDVDRVRLEFRADDYDLSKHKIRELKNFFEGPKFKAVNQKVYSFKRFDGKRFSDRKDFHSSLMEELIEQRKKVKNATQYLEDVPEWDPLKKRMLSKMDEFDYLWAEAIIYQ